MVSQLFSTFGWLAALDLGNPCCHLGALGILIPFNKTGIATGIYFNSPRDLKIPPTKSSHKNCLKIDISSIARALWRRYRGLEILTWFCPHHSLQLLLSASSKKRVSLLTCPPTQGERLAHRRCNKRKYQAVGRNLQDVSFFGWCHPTFSRPLAL